MVKQNPHPLSNFLARFKRSRPLQLIAILLAFLLIVLCSPNLQPDSYRAILHGSANCPSSLPLLLNLPAFLPSSTNHTPTPSHCLYRSPSRWIHTYAKLSSKIPDHLPPYIPHLHEALSRPAPHLSSLQTSLSDPKTLTLQLSPENPDDKDFIAVLLSLLPQLNPTAIHVLIDQAAEANSTATTHLQETLKSSSRPVPTVHSLPAYDILQLAYKASNVLVDHGPMGALVALCVPNTLYYNFDLLKPYFLQNSYKWLLTPHMTHIPQRNPTTVSTALKAMGAVTPSTCDFQPFGHGDGEKVVCANAKAFSTSDCWVLSVGCAGKWSFEQEIVERTECQVHTFDCTGDWTVPTALADRVTLHKICLGAEDDEETNFMSWGSLIRVASGENSTVMPTVAKMDIEGFEHPVMRALLASKETELYPQQIAMEVHIRTNRDVGPPYVWNEDLKTYEVSAEEISEFFGNLSSVGYRLVHRADNPFCGHCSEITLLREQGLPPVR